MDSTDRFFCPYPGCQRSFIDLWRLKVHYRADPDVRGSGRERGHGRELPACPKCKVMLERGRHHVNCKAGKATPSQMHKKLHDSTTHTDGRMKEMPPPKKLRRDYASNPYDSASVAHNATVEGPWPSGKMMVMPCSIQKGIIFSAESEEVKVISGHALFLPSHGNAKAYFFPIEAVPLQEK